MDEPENLDEFANMFNKATSGRLGDARIGLIMFIESARALVRLVDICKSAKKIQKNQYKEESQSEAVSDCFPAF